MKQYVLRRLLLAVPTLVLVSIIVFAMMRLMPGDVVLRMVEGHAYAPAVPVKVELRLNGSNIGSFSPDAAWRVHELALPADHLRQGPNILELRFDRTARPKDHEAQSNDTRALALRVDSIALTR